MSATEPLTLSTLAMVRCDVCAAVVPFERVIVDDLDDTLTCYGCAAALRERKLAEARCARERAWTSGRTLGASAASRLERFAEHTRALALLEALPLRCWIDYCFQHEDDGAWLLAHAERLAGQDTRAAEVAA